MAKIAVANAVEVAQSPSGPSPASRQAFLEFCRAPVMARAFRSRLHATIIPPSHHQLRPTLQSFDELLPPTGAAAPFAAGGKPAEKRETKADVDIGSAIEKR